MQLAAGVRARARLGLPALRASAAEGRPEGQEIEVIFSYDVNQMMQCSFTDVASGLKQKVELHPAEAKKSSESLVEKFTVE